MLRAGPFVASARKPLQAGCQCFPADASKMSCTRFALLRGHLVPLDPETSKQEDCCPELI